MDLKATVTRIVREEMEDYLADLQFTGPYEAEDIFVIVELQREPDDFEERNSRMRDRVWALGYDVGIFVDFPEATTSA